MARRLELLAWARKSGAFIVEDDYTSEFRYSGPPLASLQGLDESEQVIYVGTLNKALFPGLRLGYAVTPRALLSSFVSPYLLPKTHSLHDPVVAADARSLASIEHVPGTKVLVQTVSRSVTASDRALPSFPLTGLG